LNVQSVTNNGGKVVIFNKTLTYTSPQNFTGTDSFSYTISDTYSPNPTKQLTTSCIIDVDLINQPPISSNDYYSVPRSFTAVFDVLTNDTDLNLNPIFINFIDSKSFFGIPLSKTTVSNFDKIFYSAPNISVVDNFQYSCRLLFTCK